MAEKIVLDGEDPEFRDMLRRPKTWPAYLCAIVASWLGDKVIVKLDGPKFYTAICYRWKGKLYFYNAF